MPAPSSCSASPDGERVASFSGWHSALGHDTKVPGLCPQCRKRMDTGNCFLGPVCDGWPLAAATVNSTFGTWGRSARTIMSGRHCQPVRQPRRHQDCCRLRRPAWCSALDRPPKKLLGEIPVKIFINAVAFSPDGKKLLTVGADRQPFGMWSPAKCRRNSSHKEEVLAGHSVEWQVGGHHRPRACCMFGNPQPASSSTPFERTQPKSLALCCPDGLLLATANENAPRPDPPVQIRLECEFRRFDSRNEGTTSASGAWHLHRWRTTVSGSEDKTVKMWEPPRAVVAHPQGHTDDVLFGLQSRRQVLATPNDDNLIRLWDANSITEGPESSASTALRHSPI